MKRIFLSFALTFVLLPAAAQAQNVLVPQESTTSAKPAAAKTAEAPAVLPQAVPTVPSYPLDAMLQKSAQTAQPAPSNQLPNMYIDPAMQQQLIANEKRNLMTLQGALNQSQQTELMLSSGPNAQQNKAFLTYIQQTTGPMMVDAQQQLVRAQKRLEILSAGPIKLNDMARLYQGGY